MQICSIINANNMNTQTTLENLKLHLPVLQMTCASCAVSVESIVKNLPGVIDANVNYASAKLSIEIDPKKITVQKIKKAIQSVGYDLLIEDEHSLEGGVEEINRKNYKSLKNKVIWSISLSIPVVIIGMFFMDFYYGNYIMFVLSSPVVLWFGRGFFINAIKQAKHKKANMDTLVALSTGVAYVYSVFNLIYPEYWHSRGLHPHVYFEAAAIIIAFILLGRLLEEKAKGNTSFALKKLIGLRPKTVNVLDNEGQIEVTAIEDIVVGDVILVKPGEKIAVDGKLLEGESYVDEAMLSGEPIPVLKLPGNQVFAGSINQKGSFTFEANKVGADTILARIIEMVRNAQESKAPIQKLVDKVAGIFVPIVIVIAAVSFLVWNILGGENAFTQGLLAAVTVLVIACPCALGLATPTAIMVGVGKAAQMGILIKDAESLEIAKNLNTIVLDKTGTLTEGKAQVSDIYGLDEPELKQILLSIELQSEHPLAAAVVGHFKKTQPLSISHFESFTGKGAQAMYGDKIYRIGTLKWLSENHIYPENTFQQKADEWASQGKTLIWFAKPTRIIGLIAISDKLKDSSMEAVKNLHSLGIEVHMLTGDTDASAAHVAKRAGIVNVAAELLPEQKLAYIQDLQKEGKIVAMVGDGINDSAALAQANISIAMGTGSDIAMDVAKMTIISSDLNKIPLALKLSAQTVATIRQNLFWAFIYNVIGIPIAAGLLYPINGFLLNPMIAGAAMALSSLSVVSNSLWLKYKN
jgi:P-type Cu2+ transporter